MAAPTKAAVVDITITTALGATTVRVATMAVTKVATVETKVVTTVATKAVMEVTRVEDGDYDSAV